MSNESEREQWMRRHKVRAYFDPFSPKEEHWLVWHSLKDPAICRQTQDAALRALCEANGWELPGFLRTNPFQNGNSSEDA